MARVQKPLIIAADAPGIGLSIDDPTKQGYNNYLSNVLGVSQPGTYADLQQQLQAQGLGGSGIGGIGGPSVPVDVSQTPNISPFPLGCPPNMYQSGNVCIPMVGSFPGSVPGDTGGNLGGYDLPKGVIEQVQLLDANNNPLTAIAEGDPFYVQVFFKNAGGVAAQFFIHISMPSINIDTQSNGTWIPEFSNGTIYKRIVMPTNAPVGQDIQGTAAVEHLDTGVTSQGSTPAAGAQGTNVVDDQQNFTVPGPTASTGGNQGQNCPPGTRWSNCYQQCMPAGIAEPAPGSAGCVGGTGGTGQPCVQTQMCMQGYHWDSTQCTCVPDTAGGGGTPTPSCFTVTLSQLAQYARAYPQVVYVQNPQYLVGLILQQGLDVNNTSITFCHSGEQIPADGCVAINQQIFCPTATAGNNNNSPASIVLDPPSNVKNGTKENVSGTGFSPNEGIQVTLTATLQPVDMTSTSASQYANRILQSGAYSYADDTGAFKASVAVPALPVGLKANAMIQGTGTRSLKTASASVSIT